MPFIIIDTEGRPLRDIDGETIVLSSRKEALPFLKPGEQVAAVPVEGKPETWPAPER